jgi:hypothetical protein
MTWKPETVDPGARLEVVRLLEEFVDGKRTGISLYDSLPKSEDPAIEGIRQVVWHLFDDIVDQLVPVTPQAQELLGRCTDFLRTDLPYRWPIPNRWLVLASMPLSLLTLGLANRIFWRRYDLKTYWPFESQPARDGARRSPAA